MERITTTERHAELREAVTQAADATRLGQQFDVSEVVDAVLPFIEQERVRVVEGLVATIKALPAFDREGQIRVDPIGMVFLSRERVLAVVEAAK